MPKPDFPEKFERLIGAIGAALNHIVKSDDIKTVNQAICVKKDLMQHLRTLNARFHFADYTAEVAIKTTTKEFPNQFERLVAATNSALSYMVRSEEIQTAAQAIRVKSEIARNVGILNARFGLPSNARPRQSNKNSVDMTF